MGWWIPQRSASVSCRSMPGCRVRKSAINGHGRPNWPADRACQNHPYGCLVSLLDPRRFHRPRRSRKRWWYPSSNPTCERPVSKSPERSRSRPKRFFRDSRRAYPRRGMCVCFQQGRQAVLPVQTVRGRAGSAVTIRGNCTSHLESSAIQEGSAQAP